MDARSLSNLQTLHPKFMQQAIDAWTQAEAAMPSNVQVIVICGIRTFAESNMLYSQGRTTPRPIVTNAPAGESFHNYGLAFDFDMVTDGKDDNVVGPHWMTVVGIMKAAGMEWGGDWASFPDNPHFENRYGYTWQQLLAKHNSGDFIPGTTFVNI
jgi:peptidoglycan L-alanyl-D-glutamate endopeptidase CwlK